MNFGNILIRLDQGSGIKRPHWGGYWTTDEGESIPLSLNDKAIVRVGDAPGTLYSEDIKAEDWQTVEVTKE